ncbi:MAG: hypothetical protein ACI9JN_002416 [Bacteroidia bacterium]
MDLDDFSGIDLRESADVTITQGRTQKVTVTGHGNIIDMLKTNVDNDLWAIDLGRGCFRDYKIEIVVPNMNTIILSGSGSINIDDFKNQTNVDLSILGSGKIELECFEYTKNLDVQISGSGDVIGYDHFDVLKNMDVRISGSGSYDAYPIETDNATIKISGSGNCYTTVLDQLDVAISGSGKVRYHGDPKVNKKISGSGSVRKTD